MSIVSYWVNCSAVGDTVCCVPVVKALIAEGKLYKVFGSARTCEILRICGIAENLIVQATPEEVTAFDLNGSELVGANCPGHAAYRIHLVDLFSAFPINAILKPEEKCVAADPELLPDISHLPLASGRYVVIGVGFAQLSRKLPLKAYTAVVNYCKDHQLDVVLLGGQRKNSQNPICFEGYPDEDCTNLIDKITIAESVAVMADAACVVGIDSGLIHLASLTETPIVCGFTCVDPYYRAPYRHGIKGWGFYPVEPRSDCKYCTNRLAMFGVAFDVKCPFGKGYECATSLHADDYVAKLKMALSTKVRIPIPKEWADE